MPPEVSDPAKPTVLRWPKLDPWLDLMLPLSLLSLLVDGKREPHLMAGLISAWLVVKLINRPASAPFHGVLVFLLAGQLFDILAQSKYPASTHSDLLLAATAFACGYLQTRQQWQRSLMWVFSLLPVSLLVLRPEQVSGVQILTLLDINRNRSAFLFGLIAVVAVAYACKGMGSRQRWLGSTTALVSYALAIATGSRAGAVIPLLSAGAALVIDRLARDHTRASLVRTMATSLAAVVVLGTIGWGWYAPQNSQAERNQLSDQGRLAVMRCYGEQAMKNFESSMVGLGQGSDRVSALCAHTTPWARSGKGVMHAHNTFVQTFAENGGITVGLLVAVLIWCGRASWMALAAWPEAPIPLAAAAVVVFVLLFAQVDGTLIRFPLQQVLQGYLLALPFAYRPTLIQRLET